MGRTQARWEEGGRGTRVGGGDQGDLSKGRASCQPVGVGDLDTGAVGGPQVCTGVALANGDSQTK